MSSREQPSFFKMLQIRQPIVLTSSFIHFYILICFITFTTASKSSKQIPLFLSPNCHIHFFTTSNTNLIHQVDLSLNNISPYTIRRYKVDESAPPARVYRPWEGFIRNKKSDICLDWRRTKSLSNCILSNVIIRMPDKEFQLQELTHEMFDELRYPLYFDTFRRYLNKVPRSYALLILDENQSLEQRDRFLDYHWYNSQNNFHLFTSVHGSLKLGYACKHCVDGRMLKEFTVIALEKLSLSLILQVVEKYRSKKWNGILRDVTVSQKYTDLFNNPLKFEIFSDIMYRESVSNTDTVFFNIIHSGLFTSTNESYSKDQHANGIAPYHEVGFACSIGFSGTCLTTNSEGFRFFSCYTEPYLSFKLYFNPLQANLWLGLLGVMFCLQIYFHLFFYCRCKIKDKFRATLMLLAVTLEQSADPPAKFEKLFPYRIVYGLWILILIIFVNAYKGIAITEISSPLPGKPVENFKDLISTKETKCSSPKQYKCTSDEWKRVSIAKFSDQETKALFDIYSHPIPDGIMKETNFQYFLRTYFVDMRSWNNKEWRSEQFLLSSFRGTYGYSAQYYNSTSFSKYMIEKELAKCGKRVFVDWEETTLTEFENLSKLYPKLNWFLSKETLAVAQRGWFFENPVGPIPQNFKTLLESGIYSLIRRYTTNSMYSERFRHAKQSNKTKFDRFKAINTGHSIQVVFYVFLVGACLSILRYVYEYFRSTIIFNVKHNRKRVVFCKKL